MSLMFGIAVAGHVVLGVAQGTTLTGEAPAGVIQTQLGTVVTMPGSASVKRLNESEIREKLVILGMSEIRELTNTGDVYTAAVDRFGETVRVKVDTRTGEVVEPSRLSDSQLRTKLEGSGWKNVGTPELANGRAMAVAERDGRRYRLTLDLGTGAVMRQKPE